MTTYRCICKYWGFVHLNADNTDRSVRYIIPQKKKKLPLVIYIDVKIQMINAYKNTDISVRYQIPQDHGCQKFFAYGNTDNKILIWMSGIIYHKTTAAKNTGITLHACLRVQRVDFHWVIHSNRYYWYYVIKWHLRIRWLCYRWTASS